MAARIKANATHFTDYFPSRYNDVKIARILYMRPMERKRLEFHLVADTVTPSVQDAVLLGTPTTTGKTRIGCAEGIRIAVDVDDRIILTS
jgi:hypothetical protein